MSKESISPAHKKLMDKGRQINKIQARFFDDLKLSYRTKEVSPETTKAFINDVAVFAAVELMKLQPELKEIFPNIEAIINAILAARFTAEPDEDENNDDGFHPIYDHEIILAALFELAGEYKNNKALVKIHSDNESLSLEEIALLAWKVVSINQERMGFSRDLFGGETSFKLLKP